REQPAYLMTFASVIRELARYCRSAGLRLPGLRSLCSYSETIADDLADLCQEAFGAELVDVYSAAEVGYLALQCPERKQYHAQSETHMVEVLDQRGQPCPPGTVGTVVVTPFYNYAMPLLRYSIGDLAEVGTPCGCGRTLPALARIVGRSRDLVVLPSGGRRFA